MQRPRRCLNRGRADPFGLLVLVVILALFITIAIQAQAASPGVRDAGPRAAQQQPID